LWVLFLAGRGYIVEPIQNLLTQETWRSGSLFAKHAFFLLKTTVPEMSKRVGNSPEDVAMDKNKILQNKPILFFHLQV
jgi:hypothetical protein